MDVNALLGSLMGSTGAGIDKAVTTVKSGNMPGGLLGGAAAGGLAALLLSNKKARKMGTKALKYGGMAAIGGLAYKAWSDHKANQATAQPAPTSQTAATNNLPGVPAGSIFDLAAEQHSNNDNDIRLVLIQAMISAAKADGHIDATEQARIEQQINSLSIGADEQQFLVEQLRAPSDPIAVARLSSSEEQAAEIYLATLLAVDLDTQEERRYVDRLGDALLLSDDLRQNLEQKAQLADS